MAIQAIETSYGGHRFRSRTEARWAIFLDTLGIKWEYEPQGYRVGEQRRPYLPDFYLSDLGWWIEVKGARERLDISLLVDAVHPALGLGRTDPYHMTNLLILGPIPQKDGPHAHWSVSRSAVIGTPHGGPSTPGGGCGGRCVFTGPRFGLHYFAAIPAMKPVVAERKHGLDSVSYRRVRHLGALLLPAARTQPNPPTEDMTEALPLVDADFDPALARAYTAARSARFEHGETP